MSKLPKIPSGMDRAFVKCKKCPQVAYYDYIPFGLSAGIMTMPCGHGLTQRFSDGVSSITKKEFLAAAAKKKTSRAA